MNNEASEEFMNYFNKIEKYLKKLDNSNGHKSFGSLIDKFMKKDDIIKYYYEQLKHIKDIRNVLIHNNVYYAIPNKKTLKMIKEVCDKLINPPMVIPFFSKEAKKVYENDSIIDTVKMMKRNSYSQVPVIGAEGKVIDVLTNNTISRWIGELEDEGGGRLIMDDTPVSEVLMFREDNQIYKFISRDLNLASCLEIFNQTLAEGKELDALLITNSGKKHEELLGIITNWDLPRIYEELNNV